MKEITPKNSRYIPFTQQPSCCVPACISMIMYKRGIPLIPQEELGYYLGLVVSKENEHFFYKLRAGKRPVSGYGTQIYKDEYNPNNVFPKLGIPLEMIFHPIDEFKDVKELENFISQQIKKDADMLICFDHGELKGSHEQGGHVCVIDRIFLKNGEIRLIDPQRNQPKWRTVKAEDLYKAMKFHGSDKMSGVWEFEFAQEFADKELVARGVKKVLDEYGEVIKKLGEN